MEPHSPGNKVFELIKNKANEPQLWFKGKLIDREVLGIDGKYGWQVDVEMDVREIFDFEGQELPQNLHIKNDFIPQRDCRELLSSADVYWREGQFVLEFVFWMSDEAAMFGDVNPNKTFVGIWEKAKANGYKGRGDV